MIKVVIADDVKILRQGLKAIIGQAADMEVAGLAADGKEAYVLCRDCRPDVVMMDMRMPDYDGAYGTRKIKEEFPETKILVLTTFDDKETVEAAMESGADGYILKEMADEMVLSSIRSVHAGIRVFGDSVFARMKEQMAGKPPISPAVKELTARDRDILRLIAAGMDNKEIAGNLFLAEGTVRNQISRLLEKLKLKDRTQLAVFAVKNDLD